MDRQTVRIVTTTRSTVSLMSTSRPVNAFPDSRTPIDVPAHDAGAAGIESDRAAGGLWRKVESMIGACWERLRSFSLVSVVLAAGLLSFFMVAPALGQATTQPLGPGVIVKNEGSWLGLRGCTPAGASTGGRTLQLPSTSCKSSGISLEGMATVTFGDLPAATITLDPGKPFPQDRFITFASPLTTSIEARGKVTIDKDPDNPDIEYHSYLYARAQVSDPINPPRDPNCPSTSQCADNDVKKVKPASSVSLEVTHTVNQISNGVFTSDFNGETGYYFYIDGYVLLSSAFNLSHQIVASTRAEIFYPAPGLVVSSISPAYSSNIEGLATDPLAVTITGKGFKPGATVTFADRDGVLVTADDVVVASETKITAKLPVVGRRDGLYGVTVKNSDGKAGTGQDLFAITSIFPRIEINQGVPMACVIRPCIADHDTWVRVKLTADFANRHLHKPVTGRLHVTRNGATVEGSPFRPQPATMLLPAASVTPFGAPALSRGEEALNFRFGELDNLSEGTYDFRLEIDPRDPTVAPSGIADREKYLTRELKGQPFLRSNPGSRFRLSFIIDQTATQARLRPIDPFELVEFMRAAFPISRDLVEVRLSSASLRYGQFEDFQSAIKAVIKRASVEPLASRVKTYSVLVSSDATLDSPGTSVSCDGSECWTWGNGVILRDYGPADTQAALAHEIGHHSLLGDTYLSFDGSEQRGPHNPVSADCLQLINGCPVDDGNLDTLLGTLSVRIEPSDVTPFLKRDIMGNADREKRWIDTRTWDYLYTRFNSAGSGSGIVTHAVESFIEIAGSIGQNDAVTFDSLLGTPLDDSNPNSGPYSAELQDAAGQVLASQSFDISFKLPHRTTTLTAAPFRLALPYSSSAARAVIRKGSTEIGSRAISKNAPTVNVLFPNGGETIGATADVSWQGSDADGDALTYSVLYSPDGTNWSALVTDLDATTYRWDTALSAGSSAARIMVIADDGANQTSDTSDGTFTVGGKAPIVAFTYPPDGFVAASGQPVSFEAMAYDLEDGPLPASALSYSSSLQGALGGGKSVTVPDLAVGTHTITLTATDSDGNRSSSQIMVTIFTPAAETRYIPAVGSTAGSGGSFFKTAVQLHNPTAAAIAGKLVYHPQGRSGTAADPSLPYMLLPQQTIAFEDLLPQLGQAGLGSVDLVATYGPPPVSVIRIFNDAGDKGTTGMTEELFRESDALKAGESGVLIAPIDPAKARYNIGIRSLGSGAAMNIKLLNSLGALRTSTTQQYGPTYFVQVSAAALLGMAPAASDTLVFDIISGSALIYGASTDNLTQDPSLQIARPLTLYAGSGRRVLPVVGSAAGSLGSFFRTSVQLHNPGAATITGNLRFHPAGRSGAPSDPSMPYALAPGATFSTPDVLQSMGQAGLGSMDIVPNGSSVPVSVVRIYNDAGAAGTTGLTEEQMTTANALGAGESGILVTPPDPKKARFNLGIRTLDTGATLTITLRSATGEVRKVVTPVFAPNYFQQTTAAQLLGEAPLANETITVRVNTGNAIVYGSSTDNKTQDPSLQLVKRE